MEFSDDQVDDDGWESSSIHSGDEVVPSRLRPLSTDSDSESESESDSTSDAGSLPHSNPKTKSGVKPKAKSLSGDDDESTPDSDSDSDTPLPPSHLQKKVPKPSGGGLRRFYLLSQLNLSPGLETRTQRASWRPWKAKVRGRTGEVNEPEECKFSLFSRSDNDNMVF